MYVIKVSRAAVAFLVVTVRGGFSTSSSLSPLSFSLIAGGYTISMIASSDKVSPVSSLRSMSSHSLTDMRCSFGMTVRFCSPSLISFITSSLA